MVGKREASLPQREERELVDHGNFGKRKYRNLSKSRPSDKEQSGVEAGELLGIQANTGKELGTEVHALFEKVEWWEEKSRFIEMVGTTRARGHPSRRWIFLAGPWQTRRL